MTDKIQKLNAPHIDPMQDFVRDVIKETAAVVQNATKYENSGLIRKMDDTLNAVVTKMGVLEAQQKIYTDHVIEVKKKFDDHATLMTSFAIALNDCTANNKSTATCVESLQRSLDITKKQAETTATKLNNYGLTIKVAGVIVVAVTASFLGLITIIYNKDIDRLDKLDKQYEELKSSLNLPLNMALR